MKKCKLTNVHKTKFKTEKQAGKAMMRCWSRVPNVNIYDMHTYKCQCGFWHFGHISYFEAKQQKEMKHENKENTNQQLFGSQDAQGSIGVGG